MLEYKLDDTIAACATAPGESGVAIVRVSGPGAEGAMRRFFSARPPKIESHKLYYGHIINAGEREEALCALMRAPKSYTRQDVCEFQIHGGGEPVKRLLLALYDFGIRPAQPGEFTKRAFLNGRIDLSQAEAVMSVLRAKSDAALKAGLREMDGGVARYVDGARRELEGMRAKAEAALDFPEEIEETEVEGEILGQAKSLKDRLAAVISARAGDMLRRGVSIVLVGRPNVGKSSIMNALLGARRAIVTQTAGTTRDVLTEELEIDGYRAQLSDTAGQRATRDEVERIGVEMARHAADNADIVLLVLDKSAPLTDEDRALINAADERYALVLNKRDLAPAWDESALGEKFDGAEKCEIEATRAEGVANLRALLERLIAARAEPDAVFVRERHILCAKRATAALEAAISTLEGGAPIELAELDLRGAYEALGEITGHATDEDVINRIFTDFCVGK